MLTCPDCGRRHEDRWRCTCGHPLDVADPPRPDGSAPAPAAVDRDRGLWAFEDFLPVGRRVTLGEGFTPLVEAPRWDAAFKLEYCSPTGSFKDRGAATTLSRAVELGVEAVVEDSSGNAGAAVAAYAARAGIDARIYVPASAPAGKLAPIERYGATVVRVDGDRAAVTDAAMDAVGDDGDWYASHAWRPTFLAGTATAAYEVAAARGWTAPDAVVTPLGHGTLFLGLYRGFRALHAAGWIDDLPRLVGAQATGYAPIAADRRGDGGESNDLADGIQIRDPVRREAIHAAIEATGGDAVGVDEAATERELDALRRRGFDVEPTCAVAPAALRDCRDRGLVPSDADVVVPLTGRPTG